jgi:hypothetical protein
MQRQEPCHMILAVILLLNKDIGKQGMQKTTTKQGCNKERTQKNASIETYSVPCKTFASPSQAL